MSMGYIPKKRLYLKRQRKLRKKYKNFSCETCGKRSFGECNHRYLPTQPFGIIVCNVSNCKYWKASEEAKMNAKSKVIQNKPKIRTKIKKILKNVF